MVDADMTLSYYPRAGEVLLCNYDTGFVPPEMVKRRPVVVVSPRLRRRGEIVTVVPLSTTPPEEALRCVCRIVLTSALPPPFDAAVMWAKCDMVVALARTRLDRFKAGRKIGAPDRSYVSGQLSAAQLAEVRAATAFSLGIVLDK